MANLNWLVIMARPSLMSDCSDDFVEEYLFRTEDAYFLLLKHAFSDEVHQFHFASILLHLLQLLRFKISSL